MAIPNAVKFKKGQSGNPKGMPPKLFEGALRRALNQEDPKKKTIALHRIAAARVREAEAGNVQAINMIAERTDGKVAQALQHVGADGGPVQIGVEVSFCQPPAK